MLIVTLQLGVGRENDGLEFTLSETVMHTQECCSSIALLSQKLNSFKSLFPGFMATLSFYLFSLYVRYAKNSFGSSYCCIVCNNYKLQSYQFGIEGCLFGQITFYALPIFFFSFSRFVLKCFEQFRRVDSSRCYLEKAVITVNPPSKVFPQDNYCFGDSSCSPCPSLFAQNILLPAIFWVRLVPCM